MRCPDCNKFVGNEENEPEVESVEVDDEGHVNAEVRIVNACAECGTDLTEATLSMDGEADTIPCSCKPEDRELEAEEAGSERSVRIEGKGRGTKTFYGATLDVTVRCGKCNKEWTVTMEDEIQASGMDQV